MINKKMQHSCGVTYSIVLIIMSVSKIIFVNLLQLHDILFHVSSLYLENMGILSAYTLVNT